MRVAALDLQDRRRIDVQTQRDLECMPIWKLRELARQQNPDHHEAAARVFVNRVLEMAVEWLTDYRHANNGHHNISPAALLGEQPGGGTKAAEPLLIHYERGERQRDAHLLALRFVQWARLSPRQLLAVLIQARKLDRRQKGSEWAASYNQIAGSLGYYAQQLGFSSVAPVPGHTFDCIDDRVRQSDLPRVFERVYVPCDARERGLLAQRYMESQQGAIPPKRVRTSHRVPVFKDGRAIKNAATQARAQLILLAKLG